ncbi:uncharacterized protein LOC124448723 isoform X2 [Xenia sp. Carnegie-2017]|uniref:uncharacterized protein LOC124448723 isoform X2 n=1 Tax=Xenia sp. Carnegie-2017 TaxID=2897299 RepID=UPI001F04EA64|nr:uncharacterized protein LOC124448723 isoform X2 [Xenia sp. Carnegie-2017]
MATSATQDDCHKNEKVRSKMNIYHEAIHSSFVAGLLFLYSTVSLWPFQVCEDVDLYEPITFAAQQPQNIVNIVTYNASAPFSLHA